MRVLVTGATGFVASHLLPVLADEGHEVVALGHDRERIPRHASVEPLEVDLREVTGKLPETDAVVHLAQANVPFPDGAAALFAVNTASTAHLLEHAHRCGAARFVFASSASVYGFGSRPFLEDDRPAADDFYSATKLAAEQLVGAYAGLLGTTTLRLVAPYGPGQRGRLIPSLVARVRDGRPITLNGGGRPRMNPIYVDDVVRTIVRALELEGDDVVNVGGDETASIRELGILIGDALGIAPRFEDGAGEGGGDLVVDNSRLRKLLRGRELVTLRAGLQQTVGAGALA